ncbi:MAG: ThuA domain-containing protein, partial [Isosphaeraceae bacterium]
MIRRAILTLAACLAGTPILTGATPQPLKALFLGDHGHHRPAERAAQLIPVLAGRGIDVTYTDKIADLNPETLGKYDALIVYANLDTISPDQERALIDYVDQGGGFVPIHCASACFNHSDAYIALVGGRFASHGVGEFDTKVVAPDHPIMKGLEPFHTWDETYIHDRHNENGR